MRERGTDSTRASEAAALATRPAKSQVRDVGELRSIWLRRAAEHGLSTEHLGQLIGVARSTMLSLKAWAAIADDLWVPTGSPRRGRALTVMR